MKDETVVELLSILDFFDAMSDTSHNKKDVWINQFAHPEIKSGSAQMNQRVTDMLLGGQVGPQSSKRQSMAESKGDAKRCYCRFVAGKFTLDELFLALKTLKMHVHRAGEDK